MIGQNQIRREKVDTHINSSFLSRNAANSPTNSSSVNPPLEGMQNRQGKPKGVLTLNKHDEIHVNINGLRYFGLPIFGVNYNMDNVWALGFSNPKKGRIVESGTFL